MRLIGYTRVSTIGQAKDGLGLPEQSAAIRHWAKIQGFRLVRSVSDEAISGQKGQDDNGVLDLSQRPALAEILDAIESGKADGIAVHRLDRLARKLTLQEAILSHIWKHGGRVFSVDVGEVRADDDEDPMRTFVRQVMGAAAQLERGMIVARLKAGRRRKASNGGYAYGSPAFGYRADRRDLVPDEEESQALFRMASLRSSNASIRQIARTLDSEGHRPKRSQTWNAGTLSRTLRRLDEVMADAPKDLLAALNKAQLVNQQLRATEAGLPSDVSTRLTMALQKQGQGFRVALYGSNSKERANGLRILKEGTQQARELLARVDS